jgi:hypothetical protein
MGKRSDFERKPLDYYPTPVRGVEPLIPYLKTEGVRSFAETCETGRRKTRRTIFSRGNNGR